MWIFLRIKLDMLVVGAMTLNVKDFGYTFNLKYENNLPNVGAFKD